MKIKHKFFLGFAILMLAGCASSGYLSTSLGAYDPSVPPEKSCTLEVTYSLTVTHFDDVEVKWHNSFGSCLIDIPEGSHSFYVDYEESSNSYSLSGGMQSGSNTAKHIPLKYTFEAGKTYVMESQVYGTAYNRRVSINIRQKQ